MPSVLNLRNGGGKTSLLSLVYLVLLPLRHDFLGKVNGSDRVIEDYFTPGKLGIVALELESHAGRFGLILAWVRKDRDENPSLFSFRTGENGILFDDLPVQGLSAAPAASLSEFQTWLEARHEERPGPVDLYIAPNYRKWQAHLRTQRGVDPHLYRTHLKMNKAEGAVDEMFKFARPRDFIRQYLEFAIEPPVADGEALDPVTAILNEHRLSLAKRPHYERERDFIDQVQPRLRELDDSVVRQRQATLDRTRAFGDLQRLAGGVLYWEKYYKTKQADCAAELATKVTECDLVVNTRENAKRYASGFDRLARDLAIGEAQVIFRSAENEYADCRAQTRLLEAAIVWRAVREAEAKLRALQEKQRMLEQELRPEREEVERRALRLNAAFARALSSAEKSCSAARSEELGINERLKKLRAQKEASVQKVARLESELAAQQNQISRANRARERLIEEGSLLTREDAAVALKRHDDEAVRFKAVAESRRGAAKEARQEAAQHRAEGSRLLAQAARDEAIAEKAKAEMDGYEKAREACATLPAVRQVLEDGDFDPFNAGLVNALRALADAKSKELLALGIERAEDQRILKDYDPEVYPLFSAPAEVTRLVAYLHSQKVRGVFTAYEWLSQNTLQAEAARERMRSDPAAYAGIVVNTKEDFEMVQRLAPIFRLARPVRVTLSSRLDSFVAAEGITFLPDRAGLFNSHAAAVEIGRIRDEQAVLDERAEEVRSAAQRVARAADQVETFQQAYSVAWVSDCKTRGDEAYGRANEARRRADEEASLAQADEESAQQATNEATDYAHREGEARRHHSSVATYLADYGKHLDVT